MFNFVNFTAISGTRENISVERHRLSRKDKAFTTLPTNILFSKGGARRDKTHKREMRGKKRRGKQRHNNMTIFTFLSHHYPLDHTGSATLSQLPACPQMQAHNLLWDLPFHPACAQTWGMKDDAQKSFRGEVATVILMWFMTSLLPFSSCQGATSPVITGVCLFDQAIFNSLSRTHRPWDGWFCVLQYRVDYD